MSAWAWWLRRLIRGHEGARQRLDALADGVLVPATTERGLSWLLRAPVDRRLAARAALAWSQVLHERHGRLRPCANAECNLFLLDRSRPGTAKWCSMATCGNRMKARAHARRARTDGTSRVP